MGATGSRSGFAVVATLQSPVEIRTISRVSPNGFRKSDDGDCWHRLGRIEAHRGPAALFRKHTPGDYSVGRWGTSTGVLRNGFNQSPRRESGSPFFATARRRLSAATLPDSGPVYTYS